MTRTSQKGFTLLELLIVMALIAILVGIALAALNPGRQFANARNSTRYAHVTAVSNAISANMAENNGVFTCASGALPATAAIMADATSVPAGYDIAPCLVTEYMSSMPYDPSTAGAGWTSEATYNTGYTISQDAQGRIAVLAPGAELGANIGLTR